MLKIIDKKGKSMEGNSSPSYKYKNNPAEIKIDNNLWLGGEEWNKSSISEVAINGIDAIKMQPNIGEKKE